MYLRSLQWVSGLAAFFVLGGCTLPAHNAAPQSASSPSASASGGANPTARHSALTFIDLPSFDERLASQLAGGPASVDITFFDRVSPNQMPERLQNWIASVESAGGQVHVRQPPAPDGVTAKSPLLLISAVVSLWGAKKTLSEVMYREDLKKARAYNATLVLKATSDGGQVLERIVMTRRNPT